MWVVAPEVTLVCPAFTTAEAVRKGTHGPENGWVAVHQYRGAPYEAYFRGVEAIMDEYAGRPHWGKLHFQTAASLRDRYPQWDAFAGQRARLDPAGTFRNDYTDRVLGAVST